VRQSGHFGQKGLPMPDPGYSASLQICDKIEAQGDFAHGWIESALRSADHDFADHDFADHAAGMGSSTRSHPWHDSTHKIHALT
jgi:hypothetical protein